MGKLSREDWRAVDSDLRAEAIEILSELDRLEGRPAEPPSAGSAGPAPASRAPSGSALSLPFVSSARTSTRYVPGGRRLPSASSHCTSPLVDASRALIQRGRSQRRGATLMRRLPASHQAHSSPPSRARSATCDGRHPGRVRDAPANAPAAGVDAEQAQRRAGPVGWSAACRGRDPRAGCSARGSRGGGSPGGGSTGGETRSRVAAPSARSPPAARRSSARALPPFDQPVKSKIAPPSSNGSLALMVVW